jgi:hypothetical protein
MNDGNSLGYTKEELEKMFNEFKNQIYLEKRSFEKNNNEIKESIQRDMVEKLLTYLSNIKK